MPLCAARRARVVLEGIQTGASNCPTSWLLPSPASQGVTAPAFLVEALDKTIGGLAEGAGRVTGDKSLEAEGRATRRKGQLKTYIVVPHADGGWKVQTNGASQATSVHRTKAEAVAAAKELARGKAPSQLLVYKKDGLSVQEERRLRPFS